MPYRSLKRFILSTVLLMCCLTAVTGTYAATKEAITFATQESFEGLCPVLIREFAKLHPEIDVEWLPITGSFAEKITTLMAAGNAPDIFQMWGDPAINWAISGVLLDLRPYVKRDMTPQDIADIYPGEWEASFIRFGERMGEQYGLPMYTNVGLTYYNVERMLTAGLRDIAEISAQGQWTWDQLRQYARKLTNVDPSTGNINYGTHVVLGSRGGIRRSTGLIGSFGGRMFSFDPLSFTMHEPQSLNGLEFLRQMILDDQVMPVPSKSITTPFPSGALPIGLEGASSLTRMENAIAGAFAWKLAPWPMGPGGRVSWAAGDKYAIYRQTKNPEAAWKFLRFITSTQGAMIHAQSGYAPPRRSAIREYVKTYPERNLLAHFETAMTARGMEVSQIPRSTEVADVIGAALDRIWKGELAPQAAMDGIRSQVESLLH